MRIDASHVGAVLVVFTLVVGCAQREAPRGDNADEPVVGDQSEPATKGETEPQTEDSATDSEAAAAPGDDSWSTVTDAGSLPESHAAQLDRALKARDTMFQRLLAKLTQTIDDEGPAAAIAVCRDAAPEIAAAVSDEDGLQIGRTSFRLRNPKNTPPDWAAASVEERVEEPRYFVGPEEQLGVLLPIGVQAPCLTCHGPKEKIPGEVQQALAANYPDDQATGFTTGDLRGWFWIEVPAAGE
jgi:hypothetical protein